jgi:putative peptide zinc metalloprotease protein
MKLTDSGSLWKHVAELRPRLRKDVRILVQHYRGERWYLLHDESAGRYLRFNALAQEMLGRLDGDRTLQEILEQANERAEDGAGLTPDDVLQIMAQLHNAEVLRDGLPLTARDVLGRYQQKQRFTRQHTLSNPLAIRIPLFDPERLLNRLVRPARLLFAWPGLWLWISVVGLALLLVVANAAQLGAAIGAKTLGASEVLTFWLLYPVIKALHELGHGLAVKAWGGEVHETGITLLVFMPVPYVDASAAWAFRDKRRRALVGAAGILTELFLAALAMLVFFSVEPGMVRDLALNVALIGGISTLLFNGNPLLRFDGYYVLEDLIEVPNLAPRSSRYYLYLIQRHLLGLSDAQSPVTASGERLWFVAYGLLSPLYRLFVMIGIALYLAAEFFVAGVVLACWTVFMQVIRPLFRSLRFLLTSERLEARRLRAVGLTGVLTLSVIGLLMIPAPLVTQAEGVVWVDDEGQVVTGTDGFISRVAVASGDRVLPGQLIVQLSNHELDTDLERLEARRRELGIEHQAQRQRSRVRAAMVEDDISAVEAELSRVRDRIAALSVTARAAGRFIASNPHALQDRYVGQGEILGYVTQSDRPLVRAVIEQDRVGLLKSAPPQVEVMLAGRLGERIPAAFTQQVPAGSTALPSRALGAAGGGRIAVDMRDESGRTAIAKVFQFDLSLPDGTPVSGVGARVFVRLDHGAEPLWRQWSRSLRQLLLGRLNV